MANTIVPTVTLNSGSKISVVGFGTSSANPIEPDQLVEVLLEAVKSGYRHFDTASLYGSEKPLGMAIEKAVETGLVASRDDVFVTSKLWCTDVDADMVIPALKKSLENLKLDYLDLYLVHWPLKLKKKESFFPIEKDDILPFDMKSTWAAMEECQRLGLAKSIGVSNFSCKKLSDLLAFATIPPAFIQVEMNPAWHQKKLTEFCKENGIQLAAYSPLGANGAFWGSTAVVGSSVLKEIAQEKGKSLAQIALRWLHEQGVVVVVKSFNKDRMKQNLQIFDWELTEEERNKISNIEQKKGFDGEIFTSPNGSYKTIEELWDGEI